MPQKFFKIGPGDVHNVAHFEVYRKNRKTAIKAITEQYISRYLLSILKQ